MKFVLHAHIEILDKRKCILRDISQLYASTLMVDVVVFLTTVCCFTCYDDVN